jgi:hypothetical protein
MTPQAFPRCLSLMTMPLRVRPSDLLGEVEFGGRRVRISLSPPASQLRTSSITVPNISSVTNSLRGLADAISLF